MTPVTSRYEAVAAAAPRRGRPTAAPDAKRRVRSHERVGITSRRRKPPLSDPKARRWRDQSWFVSANCTASTYTASSVAPAQ